MAATKWNLVVLRLHGHTRGACGSPGSQAQREKVCAKCNSKAYFKALRQGESLTSEVMESKRGSMSGSGTPQHKGGRGGKGNTLGRTQVQAKGRLFTEAGQEDGMTDGEEADADTRDQRALLNSSRPRKALPGWSRAG